MKPMTIASRVSRATTMAVAVTASLLTATAARAAIAGPYTVDATTLHLWHFDEADPGPATSVGNGSLFDLTPANGAFLGAPSFPGFGTAGDATAMTTAGFPGPSIPTSDLTGADGAFTFEAIIRTPDFVTGQQIISLEAAGSPPARPFQFRIDGTQLRFINIAGAAGVEQILSPLPTTGDHVPVANEWFHAAVAYNGSENTADNIKLYWTRVDAVHTAANEILSTTMVADLGVATAPFGVANEYRSSPDQNLQGQIDEVRISNIARAPDEMLFNAGGPDEKPPLLAGTDPVDDAPTGVAASVTLTASFNEDIRAGTGNIIIRNLTDVSDTVIPVTDTNQVTVSGTTITIDPDDDLAAPADFAVLIDATAIEDLAGNAFAGIADETGWNFSTDGTAPTAIAFNPADEAVEVLIGTKLVVTFDEPVVAGTGNVTIRRTADNTEVETFDVASSPRLVFRGSTLTINPSAALPAGTGLSVEIAPTAVEDTAENTFAGLTGATAWHFTTAASESTLVLFADDFGDGSPVDPVDPNDPGSSISGGLAGSFLGAPYVQVNVGGGTLGGEAGGEASWDNLNTPGNGSGLITLDCDFSKISSLTTAGRFTVHVLGLNPVDDGDGTSGSWVAVDMFQPAPPTNGGDTTVTQPATGLGILFRDNGQATAWSAAASLQTDTFDAAPANGSYDIAIEVSHISGFGPGNSFDYRVLVGGTPVDGLSGSLTGIDTSANFITLESRSSSATISEVRVETTASDVDVIPPAVKDLSPPDDAPNVLATAHLVAVFDEPVVAGTGSIEIRRSLDDSLVEGFDIASSGQVTVDGGKLTVVPTSELPDGALYALIPSTAINDAAGNGFAGITDPEAWNFTADGTAPTGSGMIPMADATGVAPSGDLGLSFGEEVLAGTGTITIYLASDDSVVETIDVTTGAVTIDGTDVTINPAADLDYGTAYYVQVDAGAFTDLAGNPFAGIGGTTTWAFTTGPVPSGLIFSGDFAGDTSELNGTAPETRPFDETWVAAPVFSRDGLLDAGPGSATLAFTPFDGFVYVLDASLSGLNAEPDDTDWIAVGFVNGQSAGGSANDRFITGNVVGASWLFTRGDTGSDPNTLAWLGNGRLGGGNGGLAGESAGIKLSTADAIDLRVILDTTAGDGPDSWTTTWLARLPADSSYTEVRATEPLLAGTTISAVGLAISGPGVGATIESFQLSTLAPEPLALAISGNNGLLDFSWNSMSGMQYDLVSSDDPAGESDPSAWVPYNDGVNAPYENIPASGTGTTTLAGVTKVGTRRFFALIEEPVPPLVSEDFEDVTGPGVPAGWSRRDNGAGTAWEVGTPDGAFSGPAEAANGIQCAGTNIGGDYTPEADAFLVTPAFTVPATGATLSYSQYIDTDLAGAPNDAGSIRLLNAADDTPLDGGEVVTGIEGATEQWSSESIPLPAAANGLGVKLEFRFTSNDSGEFAGFYIDDVVVTAD